MEEDQNALCILLQFLSREVVSSFKPYLIRLIWITDAKCKRDRECLYVTKASMCSSPRRGRLWSYHVVLRIAILALLFSLKRLWSSVAWLSASWSFIAIILCSQPFITMFKWVLLSRSQLGKKSCLTQRKDTFFDAFIRVLKFNRLDIYSRFQSF